MDARRKRDARSRPRNEEERLRILVNGEPREIEGKTTLTQLISILQLKPEQIAIELNRTVVRRSEWPNTVLGEGDHVEIVHFVGGGNANC